MTAKSNIFGTGSVKATENIVTVTYELQSAMKLVNAQWNMTYDSSKLKLKTAVNDLCPNLSGTLNASGSTVYGVYSDINSLADFTSSKTFVQAEFEVIGKGYADVNLTVDELSVGYISGGKLQFENAVAGGVKQNISSKTGFSTNNISGKASVVNGSVSQPATDLTVNATSNFFPKATKVVAANEKQITIEYMLEANKKILNSEWTLTYDTSKLSFNSSATGSMMPNAGGVEFNETTKGRIKGSNSNTSKDNYSTERTFVKATFDVLGKGTTNVNLNVDILGLTNSVYLVDNGVVQNVSSQSGFSDFTYKTNTKFTDGSSGGPITINTTSNYFPATRRTLKDSSEVTLTFTLSSYYKLLSAQWELTYDTSKLRLKSSLDDAMPYVSDDAVVQEKTQGTIKGNFSKLSLVNYKSEKDFVTLTFDIIGSGSTTVNMNVVNIGVKNEGKTGYIVDHGVVQNLKSQSAFAQSSTSYLSMIVPNGKTDRIVGDVNFDGAVNVQDATLVQKHCAEICIFNADQRDVGDVDSDKAVDITDATRIQEIAAR